MDISIVATSGSAKVTEVPEEVAKELQDTYDALKNLPVNRAAVVDFAEAKEAREFVRQGKQWASDNGLEFSRRGVVKDNPTRVYFRIYVPRVREESTPDPVPASPKPQGRRGRK